MAHTNLPPALISIGLAAIAYNFGGVLAAGVVMVVWGLFISSVEDELHP